MNAFDRLGLERSLLARNVIPIWTQFRLAIADHAQSYNDLGPEYAARVERDASDTSMQVSCTLGMMRDRGELFIVVATISRKDETYIIEVEVQKWLRLYDHPGKKAGTPSLMHFEFRAKLTDPVSFTGADVNGSVWIEADGKTISVPDAAAKVFTALFQQGHPSNPSPSSREPA
jgi:hypothetical protein